MTSKKIKKISQLRKNIPLLKSKGKRIVFTNGCFDILHLGHIKYLQNSKSKGDILIVGINSDSSVRKLKGPSRPITKLTARAETLSALECIDYIVSFNEDTPLNAIKAIKPDILVKGGDWRKKDIVGADFVTSYGGRVLTIPFLKGYSTTNIIKSIKHAEGRLKIN